MSLEQKNKSLFKLIKREEPKQEHAILNNKALEEKELKIIKEIPNNSIWPLEKNIFIENATYENQNLKVKLNNTSVSKIKVSSMGVKYSDDNNESINFRNQDLNIPQGVSIINIPCERKPFKFVIRTSNYTALGTSRNNINW